jgi:hypothetical protein
MPDTKQCSEFCTENIPTSVPIWEFFHFETVSFWESGDLVHFQFEISSHFGNYSHFETDCCKLLGINGL